MSEQAATKQNPVDHLRGALISAIGGHDVPEETVTFLRQLIDRMFDSALEDLAHRMAVGFLEEMDKKAGG